MDEPKTLTVPEAGRVYFDLGRNASYEAARRGEIGHRLASANSALKSSWRQLRRQADGRTRSCDRAELAQRLGALRR
jgi:hypothetical protein